MTHKLPPIVSDSQNLLSIKEQSQGSIHPATSPNRVQWALKLSYLSLNSCHLHLDLLVLWLIKKGTGAHYWSFYLFSCVFFGWSIFFSFGRNHWHRTNQFSAALLESSSPTQGAASPGSKTSPNPPCGHRNPSAKRNIYVRAHTLLYFKNGSQIEIFSFLSLLIRMLNSILDHIYLWVIHIGYKINSTNVWSYSSPSSIFRVQAIRTPPCQQTKMITHVRKSLENF